MSTLCLVLDHTWEPIGQITWKQAVLAVLGDRGQNVVVLEEYEDREVRSVTFSMKIPAVIQYMGNALKKRKGIRFSKENVYMRDKGKCQYCNLPVPRPHATYDHVVPRTQGGKTRWENIVIACRDCNQKKGGRTPLQAGMRLVSEPVKPKSLPETLRLTFTRENLPEQWRSYIRSAVFACDMHADLSRMDAE